MQSFSRLASFTRRLLGAFSNATTRHAGLVALIGTLAAVAGGYYSVQLFKNLRTDIEELLPTTARSVIDLGDVTKRLESIDSLGVLIFSPDPVAGKRFQSDLAESLKSVPRNILASVEFRVDRELEFFMDRQALYMDTDDLRRVRDYIRHRIDFETSLYNPLNIFNGADIPEPKLDFDKLRDKYGGKMSAYSRFPDGFYATPDGKLRALLAYLPGKTSSIDQVIALKNAVAAAVDKLNPKSYAPDLEVKYTGGVQDTLEEHHALIEDLTLSTVVVAIAVTLAMWAYFRSAAATFALVFSLFMGTLWTFGVSYFVVGYLNANSAFLGSIVIGNGINFGIIYLARYMEERRKGIDNASAIRSATDHTSRATFTAALAAGLSYGSLMLTSFRGFSQFGVIGLIGMVLCWTSAFTLLPAYLTVLDRLRPIVKATSKPPRAILADANASFVSRFARPVWIAAIVATVLSLGLLTRLDSKILETNLANLRNKDSMTKGSAYLSKYMDQIFQRYLSPLALLPHSREDALRMAALLKEQQKREGASTLIASVQTIDDFIPNDQLAKISLLREIKALLPDRLLYRLSESDRELVKKFLTPAVFKTIGLHDLPALVLSKFTERDGSIGKLVLVEPPLDNRTWEGGNLVIFIDSIRAAADSIAPGTAVAGSTAITADMIVAITQDGPKATMSAFLAVVLLVVILFRNVRTISMILFSLIMGVLWLFGLIVAYRFKINFLNFIALPITFGIGVDYGVNIFERYRAEGGSILHVLRQTGGAVGLCSLTTMIGYSSLLIAGNQGFVSFGTLAVAGEITCLVAAIVALPALLIMRERRKGAPKGLHTPDDGNSRAS